MLGFIILGLLLVAVAFVLFSPWLKGFRTLVYGYLTIIIGAVLPLAGEIVTYLQALDWRQYVLAADRKNMIVLAIVAGLGLVAIILRHMASGRVGSKE